MSQPDLLTRAVQQHQAGQLQQAEQLYQQILAANPQQAHVYYLRGMLAYQRQQFAEAIEWLLQALLFEEQNSLYYATLGAVHQAAGHLTEAVSYFQQALHLQPDDAATHNKLGVVYQQLGHPAEAVPHHRQAITLNQNGDPQKRRALAYSLNNLGLAQQAQGHLTEAISSFQHALEALPNLARAHYNLGNIYYTRNQLTKAIVHFRQALQQQPDYVKAWNNLGLALQRQGQGAEAVHAYQQAVRHQPDNAAGHNNLGTLYQLEGRMAEAEQHFRQALAQQPNFLQAYNNLGNLLLEQNKLDEAEAVFQQGVAAAKAGHAEPEQLARLHKNLSATYHNQGRTEAAQQSLTQARHYTPHDPVLRLQQALLQPVIYPDAARMAYWRTQLLQQVEALLAEGLVIDPTTVDVSSLPTNFLSGYHGDNEREIQQLIGRLYQPGGNFLPTERPTPAKRIKLGLVSKHLRSHTVGRLMQGLIMHLPRPEFTVTVFSLAPHPPADEVAAAAQTHADAYHVLPPNLTAARQQIAAAQLDLLLYPDLGMEPFSYGLALARLAPVQCVTWGHSITSGLPEIDYFLSSACFEPPEAQHHYSETLIRLPGAPIYYERPTLPDSPKTRADFGLSAERTLYLCPQSLFKLHPNFDALLAAILRQDPAGELLLLAGRHPQWERLLRQRFAQTMPDVAERVRFMPRQQPADFLSLLAVADVMLDPRPWGGCHTSLEAFAVGTPVVTMPPEQLPGRFTAGFYQQMGLADCPCIAQTAADYVSVAVRLGTEADYRAEIRAQILAAREQLFGNISYVQAVAEFFTAVVEARRQFDAGMAHHQAGNFTAAEQCYQQLLHQPEQDELTQARALHLLGLLRHQQGETRAAVDYLLRAVALKPEEALFHKNLAAIYQTLEWAEETGHHLCRRVTLQPHDGQSHYRLGQWYQQQQQFEAALTHYRRAVRVALQRGQDETAKPPPWLGMAFDNLGVLLGEQGHYGEAAATLEQGRALFPKRPELLNNLGVVYQNQGRVAEAAAAFRAVWENRPDFAPAFSNWLLTLHYLPHTTAESLQAAHAQFGAQFDQPLTPLPRPPKKRLRVGYLSPDFRQHPVAAFMAPVLQHHDPEAVTVFCYADVPRPDAVTRRLQRFVSNWRDVTALSNQALKAQLEADALDILVDLAGHSAGNRLPVLAAQPAPLQISYLGYPHHPGLAAISCWLSDELSNAAWQSPHYYLPQGFLCYSPPPEAPSITPLPAQVRGYITFGSFNHLPKLSEPLLRVWAEILRKLPQARLFLKTIPLSDEPTRTQVMARLEQAGLPMARVTVQGYVRDQQAHLACYQQVDIALDSFPYNGTTTTCEALWMGVPVITMAGTHHVGRLGLSLLSRLGLAEWVAADEADYVDLAVALSSDLTRLAEWRAMLRPHMGRSGLCNGKKFSRQLEAAYQGLWQL